MNGLDRRLIALERRSAREPRDPARSARLAGEVRLIMTTPAYKARAVQMATDKLKLVAWAWQPQFGEPIMPLEAALARLGVVSDHD